MSKDGFEDYYLRLNPPDRAYYQKKARGYDRRFGRILDAAKVQSVLDLGCATGLLSNYLCQRGCRDVVGVDVNEQLIEVARRNVPAQFVADDAAHYLATCGRKFDVIFMLDLLEHVPREKIVELLRLARQAVNDGGFVLVRTPNMNCFLSAGQFYGDWTHLTPFTERALEHVARQAGFSRLVHCNQFRMQNFKGKIRACINAVLLWVTFRLRGGHQPKVYQRNLVAQLHP